MCVEDDYNVAAAMIMPKISDEKGMNPEAKLAPDNNEHRKPQHNNLIV
jgi:hypothetical protein